MRKQPRQKRSPHLLRSHDLRIELQLPDHVLRPHRLKRGKDRIHGSHQYWLQRRIQPHGGNSGTHPTNPLIVHGLHWRVKRQRWRHAPWSLRIRNQHNPLILGLSGLLRVCSGVVKTDVLRRQISGRLQRVDCRKEYSEELPRNDDFALTHDVWIRVPGFLRFSFHLR